MERFTNTIPVTSTPQHTKAASPAFTAKILLVLATCLISTLSLFAQTTTDPGRGGTVGGFEVDADFRSGIIPNFWTNSNYTNRNLTGDDWSKGTGGNAVLKQELRLINGVNQLVSVPGRTADGSAVWQEDGNWGNQSALAEKFSFAGNSNKNGDPIGPTTDGPNQRPYSLQVGGTGPQKNDITNTYLYSKRVGADKWLFFAAETRATNGNSYIDFEYNQNGVQIINNQLVGPAKGGNIINGRTVNDFIVVVNYTGGGNRPVVGIRTWLNTGVWSEEFPLSNTQSYMTTNLAAVPSVAPNGGFTTEGARTSNTIALQMVEGGVNLSAIPNLAALDGCNPNATVTVKTRSSSSFTAELKDLDLIRFSLTPSASATVNAVAAKCQAASGATTFNVSGTYENGTPLWSVTSPATLSNQSYVNGVATATVSVPAGTNTTTNPISVTLTTTSINPDCPSATNSKPITINPNPTATTAEARKCAATSGGTTAVFDLTTLEATIKGSQTGVTVSWFSDAALQTAIQSPASYSSASATVYAKVTNSTTECFSSTPVTLTVDPSAPAPQSEILTPLCDDQFMKVKVRNPVAGITYTISQPSIGSTPQEILAVATSDPNDDPTKANDVIFTNLQFGKGYRLTATTAENCISLPELCGPQTPPTPPVTQVAPSSVQKVQTHTIKLEESQTKVQAAPNPFREKIRFQLESAVSGYGSLEIFNAQGQRVGIAFQGYVEKGRTQTIEYTAPAQQQGALMYQFRVGDQRVSGKLINLK